MGNNPIIGRIADELVKNPALVKGLEKASGTAADILGNAGLPGADQALRLEGQFGRLRSLQDSPLGGLFRGTAQRMVEGQLTELGTELQRLFGRQPIPGLQMPGTGAPPPPAPHATPPASQCVEPEEGSGLPRCEPLFEGPEDSDKRPSKAPPRDEPLW